MLQDIVLPKLWPWLPCTDPIAGVIDDVPRNRAGSSGCGIDG